MKSTCRDVKEFKKGYQPRNDLVKDENDNLLAYFNNILNIWKNYFCQLLNVQVANNVRQAETHTAESLLHEPGSFEV
jgi:hypothetical protein